MLVKGISNTDNPAWILDASEGAGIQIHLHRSLWGLFNPMVESCSSPSQGQCFMNQNQDYVWQILISLEKVGQESWK